MRTLTLALGAALALGACGTPSLEDPGPQEDPAPDLSTPPTPDMPTSRVDMSLAMDMASPAEEMSPEQGPEMPPSCAPGQTRCGRQCVDLMQDPTSCGACGRACVIPHAEATCQAGTCAIARCELGFFDHNDQVVDGCEVEDTCQPGSSCMSGCGTEGTTQCEQGMASCQPPAESCNARDDDCDGACDQGGLPGCRVSVARIHGGGVHLYTTDTADVGAIYGGTPSNVERPEYFWLYEMDHGQSSFRRVYLCRKRGSDNPYLSDKTNCDPSAPRGPMRDLGFWSTEPVCGAQPLYHAYSPNNDNDFYTLSAGERDRAVNQLGYQDRGVAGYVWGGP